MRGVDRKGVTLLLSTKSFTRCLGIVLCSARVCAVQSDVSSTTGTFVLACLSSFLRFSLSSRAKASEANLEVAKSLAECTAVLAEAEGTAAPMVRARFSKI